MNYRLLICQNDQDIPVILSVYRLPEIAQYVSIDEAKYWDYVTSTNNVWFYKVYEQDCLVAAIHLELSARVLYMSIVVFPKHQKTGVATKILQDILNGKLGLHFDKIQVSVDEGNSASIKLFENAGFVCMGKEEELLEYVYIKS